jgi:hypothetical protein
MFVNLNKEKNNKNLDKLRKFLNRLEQEDFKQKCIDCTLKSKCEELDKCLR